MNQPTRFYQKHIDELPASSYGWAWLGEVGRGHGADNVERIEFQKLGGIVVAWKDGVLACYFVILRDLYNYTAIHGLDVLGIEDHGMDLRLCEGIGDANVQGDEWFDALCTRYDVRQTEINENPAGAVIRSAWDVRHRLIGYYVIFKDPQGWAWLALQDLNQPHTED